MKNGVEWNTAFGLEHEYSSAAGIVFGELEGRKFNYDLMDWEKS